jgi:hypothetical protein
MTNGNANRRHCLTMDLHNHLASTDEAYRTNRRLIEASTLTARLASRTSVIRIPVVVHVLWRLEAENVSDAQIRSQIDVLNRDFRKLNQDIARIPEPFKPLAADALIEFGLAVRDPLDRPSTGITRTRTSVESFVGEPAELDQQIKLAGARAWPAHHYLNLWVCNLGNSLLGYAQFPGGPAATDGVVIGNSCFGTRGTAQAPFDGGRTATHEVGHWLNLLHIWGDDRGGCTRSDNVGDTPNQADSNGGKPEFPRITCNNGPHGDLFMNYMDYVDDDSMFMFTHGQASRMDATLRTARAAVVDSKGLVPVATPLLDVVNVAEARLPLLSEIGAPPQEVFDGVTWVRR